MKNTSISKGIVAGFTGGLVASWIMGQSYLVFAKILHPSRPEQGEDSTALAARSLARPILHRELTVNEAQQAGTVLHYAFGSTVGAIYGAAAEVFPAITSAFGFPLGTAVWMGAHVITVPALNLSAPVTQSSMRAEAAELCTHLVYGGMAELVRRSIRRMLGR